MDLRRSQTVYSFHKCWKATADSIRIRDSNSSKRTRTSFELLPSQSCLEDFVLEKAPYFELSCVTVVFQAVCCPDLVNPVPPNSTVFLMNAD